MGSRNLSKTAKKSSSSPRTAGVNACVQCFVGSSGERKLDVFFLAKKAQDACWEVVRYSAGRGPRREKIFC
jgi:hypothetical protein